MVERVDLDAVQAYFEQWQKLSLDGSVIGEIATKGLAMVAELQDTRAALDQYRDYANRLEVELAEAERIIARFTEQRLKDAAERDHASGKVP